MTAAKMNIPALRFSEFNGDWQLKKLSDVSIFLDGKRKPIKSSDRAKMKGKFPYYGASGIIDYVNDFIFDDEIILLGEDGENIISRNLPLAFRVSGKCWVNNHAHVIKPIKDTNIDFLAINLERINYVKYNTGTAQPKLNQEVCGKITSKFPPLPEQQKIATFLTAVDKKISQLQQKKTLLQNYKKGIMQQLFSQQLRFKDEDGANYPDWEEKKLGEVVEINPKSEELPNSFIYIDLESVSKGILRKESRIFKSEAPSRAQRLLKKSDVLFQTVRPYQKNNYYFDKCKNDYVASTGYAQLRTTDNSKYIYQYIHNTDFVNKVLLRCTGTSYPSINSSDLGRIKIVIPSLKEQTKIANFLSTIDTKIEVVNTQIENTQQFKKGLLQQMFV